MGFVTPFIAYTKGLLNVKVGGCLLQDIPLEWLLQLNLFYFSIRHVSVMCQLKINDVQEILEN